MPDRRNREEVDAAQDFIHLIVLEAAAKFDSRVITRKSLQLIAEAGIEIEISVKVKPCIL